MKNPPPEETDYDVEVEQGTIKRKLPIKAPTPEKAINQANRILKNQRVQPARVISIKVRKP